MNPQTMAFWRQIFWLSYWGWALFELWVLSRDRQAVKGQRQDRGSLFAVVALIALGIILAFTARGFMPWARVAPPGALLFGLAAALVWGGLGFRLWAILTLGRFFRVTVTVQDEHRLVTTGPYRVLRHPSYTGSLMTLSGIGLFMNNWISLLAICLCGLVAYGIRIRVEEQALLARFGAVFEQQRARSWAMIPFVW